MARFAGFLLAAMVALLAFGEAAMAATPIGKVVGAAGSPTASGRPLQPGSGIFENDKLQTGGGNVQILFVDDTKLVVGPNSVLVIDRFLMRGGNKAQKFSVDALRGTFRFISGSSAKSAYDIQTANATIGIRGTAFDFSTGRETLLAVFEGGVRLCASGRCQSIPEGCGVGRARSNDVDELSGRAKGQALRALPYITDQESLTQGFRVNTRSCRSSLGILTVPNKKGEDSDRPNSTNAGNDGSTGGGGPGGGDRPGGRPAGNGGPGGGNPQGGGG